MLFMKRNNNLKFVYLIVALVVIDGNSNQKIVPRLCLAIVALVVIDGNHNLEFAYRVGKLLIYLYFRNWI